MELYWSRDRDRDRAEAMSRQALELASAADRPTLRYALNALHFVLWGPDHLDERLQLAHDLLERSEQDNDVEMTLQGYRWLVTDLVEAGDLVAADEQLERCAELAERARQPLYAWYVCVYRAERALLVGRYDEADRLIERAVVLGERSQSRSADVFLRVQRFALARDHLDDSDLEAATEALKPRLGMHTTYIALRALGLAELGQLEEARALFDHVMSQVTELPRDALYLSVVAVLAETGRLLQEHSHAPVLYEVLTPFAGRTIVQATPVCYGAVDFYLGLLAATLGDASSAHEHLLAAANLHRVWGAEPMLARTLTVDAAVLLAARTRPSTKAHRRRR